MTTPADDTAVEDAFEAFLAGRPVPEEAAERLQEASPDRGGSGGTDVAAAHPYAAVRR